MQFATQKYNSTHPFEVLSLLSEANYVHPLFCERIRWPPLLSKFKASLLSHLPVDGVRFLGGQKGVALQLQDARVGVRSTKDFDRCWEWLEELLKEENGKQLFSGDFKEAETYRDIYLENCFKIENRLQENAGASEAEERKFKLPKIELKKINGDPKEFLASWSQFKKIHDNSSIVEEDKMQNLLQSVEPHSKAERLILSFPATNYSKAIEQLKERFGTRRFAGSNLCERPSRTCNEKYSKRTVQDTDLIYLYDELEGKLRALETLGRTQNMEIS
ncbi:uncharacterized protein TNCV_4963301 [Trichonephila clavipes]|nr:uncharacterized protein TNCV_4963301 [Trichonephila clavipes]